MATNDTSDLTPAQRQKNEVRQFVSSVKAGGGPEDEFLRGAVEEVYASELDGELSRQRDHAVALYLHRERMETIRCRR